MRLEEMVDYRGRTSTTLRDRTRRLAGVAVLIGLLTPRVALGQGPEQARAVAELRIGETDGRLAFTRIGSIVSVGAKVFVSQDREQLVRVLSEDGALVAEWGGRGDGPGEFRGLDWIGFVDGSLQVVDYGLGRITSFDLDGIVLRTRRIPSVRTVPPPPLIYAFPIFAATGETTIIFGDHPMSAGVPLVQAPGVLVDTTGSILDSVPSLRTGDRVVLLERGGQRMNLTRPVHSAARQAMSPDGTTLVTIDDEQGTGLVLYRYDVARRARDTIRTGLAPVPVPEHYADSVRDAMIQRITGDRGPVPGPIREYTTGFDRRALERAFEIPTRVPAADALFVGPGQEVWLRRSNFGSEPDLWWVVDPDGAVRMEVQVPRGIELRARDGDRLWGISEDDLLVQYVHRLRLERLRGGSEPGAEAPNRNRR